MLWPWIFYDHIVTEQYLNTFKKIGFLVRVRSQGWCLAEARGAWGELMKSRILKTWIRHPKMGKSHPFVTSDRTFRHLSRAQLLLCSRRECLYWLQFRWTLVLNELDNKTPILIDKKLVVNKLDNWQDSDNNWQDKFIFKTRFFMQHSGSLRVAI